MKRKYSEESQEHNIEKYELESEQLTPNKHQKTDHINEVTEMDVSQVESSSKELSLTNYNSKKIFLGQQNYLFHSYIQKKKIITNYITQALDLNIAMLPADQQKFLVYQTYAAFRALQYIVFKEKLTEEAIKYYLATQNILKKRFHAFLENPEATLKELNIPNSKLQEYLKNPAFLRFSDLKIESDKQIILQYFNILHHSLGYIPLNRHEFQINKEFSFILEVSDQLRLGRILQHWKDLYKKISYSLELDNDGAKEISTLGMNEEKMHLEFDENTYSIDYYQKITQNMNQPHQIVYKINNLADLIEIAKNKNENQVSSILNAVLENSILSLDEIINAENNGELLFLDLAKNNENYGLVRALTNKLDNDQNDLVLFLQQKRNGKNILNELIRYSIHEYIAFLLEKNLDIKSSAYADDDGSLPLHAGCDRGSTEIIQMIMEGGVPLISKNHNGETAWSSIKGVLLKKLRIKFEEPIDLSTSSADRSVNEDGESSNADFSSILLAAQAIHKGQEIQKQEIPNYLKYAQAFPDTVVNSNEKIAASESFKTKVTSSSENFKTQTQSVEKTKEKLPDYITGKVRGVQQNKGIPSSSSKSSSSSLFIKPRAPFVNPASEKVSLYNKNFNHPARHTTKVLTMDELKAANEKNTPKSKTKESKIALSSSKKDTDLILSDSKPSADNSSPEQKQKSLEKLVSLDFYHVNKNGDTIFHTIVKLAPDNESAYLLSALLKKANFVSVNKQNYQGKTIFHIALERGNLVTAKIIFERGINLTLKDQSGKTAFDYIDMSCFRNKKLNEIEAFFKDLIEINNKKNHNLSYIEKAAENIEKNALDQSLRPYQKECLVTIAQRLKDQYSQITSNSPSSSEPLKQYQLGFTNHVEMATGSGKTEIFLNLIKSSKLKSTIVVPTIVLAEQTYARFRTFAPDLNIVRVSGEKQEIPNYDVCIVVGKTFEKIFHKLSSSQVIIYDEAHTYLTESHSSIIDLLDSKKEIIIVAFTATGRFTSLRRAGDHSAVEEVFGLPVFSYGIDKGIQEGFLHQVKIEPLTIAQLSTAEKLKSKSSDSLVNLLKDNNIEVAKLISEATANLKSCLIFAPDIITAEKISEALNEITPGSAKAISFRDTNHELILSKHKNQVFKYLVNVNILTSGYDDANLMAIFDLSPTHSEIMLKQRLGRLTRKTTNNDQTQKIYFQLVLPKTDFLTIEQAEDNRYLFKGGSIFYNSEAHISHSELPEDRETNQYTRFRGEINDLDEEGIDCPDIFNALFEDENDTSNQSNVINSGSSDNQVGYVSYPSSSSNNPWTFMVREIDDHANVFSEIFSRDKVYSAANAVKPFEPNFALSNTTDEQSEKNSLELTDAMYTNLFNTYEIKNLFFSLGKLNYNKINQLIKIIGSSIKITYEYLTPDRRTEYYTEVFDDSDDVPVSLISDRQGFRVLTLEEELNTILKSLHHNPLEPLNNPEEITPNFGSEGSFVHMLMGGITPVVM